MVLTLFSDLIQAKLQQQQMQIESAAANTGIRSPAASELKSPSEQNETKVATLEPPVQWIRFVYYLQKFEYNY